MAAAIELADRDGIESMSMRKLAQELGVEAMSLYTHVRNKGDLLDGMADTVISQIPVSAGGADWKTSLRQLALAARGVMLRHRGHPHGGGAGRARARRAALRQRGARHPPRGRLLDRADASRPAHPRRHLLGFTQGLFDDSGDLEPEAATALASALGASHPYVVEMALAVTHGGALGRCDDDAEFEFALDFILDGLARLHSG